MIKLQFLYDSEILFVIESQWDSGVKCSLLDRLNWITHKEPDIESAINWLWDTSKELWPDLFKQTEFEFK